jgi:anthranilate synthase component 1
VDTFGKTQPQIVPLDLSENQFQIYNKIARNYSHSFLFESLTGPEILAETSDLQN